MGSDRYPLVLILSPPGESPFLKLFQENVTYCLHQGQIQDFVLHFRNFFNCRMT